MRARVEEAAAGRLVSQASAPATLEGKDEEDPVVDLVRMRDLSRDPRPKGKVRRVHERERLFTFGESASTFSGGRTEAGGGTCRPEAVDLGDVAGDLADDPDGDAEEDAREERRVQRIRPRIGVPALHMSPR